MRRINNPLCAGNGDGERGGGGGLATSWIDERREEVQSE